MKNIFRSVPKIVLYSWLVPLISAFIALIAYFGLRDFLGIWPFVILGIIITCGGVFLSILGMGTLVWKKVKESIPILDRRIMVPSVILFSNYVVAGGIISLVAFAETKADHFNVQVSNMCQDWHVKSIKFKSPDGKYDYFDSVPSGEIIKRNYNFWGEGSVTYEALLRKADLSSYDTQKGELIGYISTPSIGNTYVSINFKQECGQNDNLNCHGKCLAEIFYE